MLAEISQSTIDVVAQALVAPDRMDGRLDRAAYGYAVMTRVERFAIRERKVLKERLLGILPTSARLRLSQQVERVRQFQISENMDLSKGKLLRVQAGLTIGKSYIDMDALRQELGISQAKFEQALLRATRRHDPSLSLDIMEK